VTVECGKKKTREWGARKVQGTRAVNDVEFLIGRVQSAEQSEQRCRLVDMCAAGWKTREVFGKHKLLHINTPVE
jgi:hypothetical protein